jgi:hypothetical protein
MRNITLQLLGAVIIWLGFTAAASPASTEAMDDLASRGAAMANADPLSAEPRKRSPDDLSRQGFDIGMAAAEGNAEPGPGKQRIRDLLSPPEQGGFDTAVSFSLQRNRSAHLAATGAAIAHADPVVSRARTAEPNVFYWLGFDIATGIFGDPALGARGNTATGPGSLGIRDALSAAASLVMAESASIQMRRR